jgi:hypothetical protein
MSAAIAFDACDRITYHASAIPAPVRTRRDTPFPLGVAAESQVFVAFRLKNPNMIWNAMLAKCILIRQPQYPLRTTWRTKRSVGCAQSSIRHLKLAWTRAATPFPLAAVVELQEFVAIRCLKNADMLWDGVLVKCILIRQPQYYPRAFEHTERSVGCAQGCIRHLKLARTTRSANW